MSPFDEVAPGVLVATSRFMTTNAVVVTHGDGALVVDPGVHDDELDALAGALRARGLRVLAGFATHAHWDHVLWHHGLGDVPRWATPATVQACRAHHDEHLDEAIAITPVDAALVGDLTPLPDPEIPWAGPAARIITHDAHEGGHAALHLPELGLLIAGDMFSDVEVPLLEHGIPGPAALERYHAGLDALSALHDVDLVIPGHGHPCDGSEWRRRIDRDRRYLDDLAAGCVRRDDRLRERWLVDADEAMGRTLDKRSWRAWARRLPDPHHQAGVRAGLTRFLDGRSGPVAAYDALPGEVDLTDLQIVDRVLPRLDGDEVTWHRVTGTVEPHRLGMLQPPADAPSIDPSELGVVLVPGRLFDRHGIRLGRGGGHYDRLAPLLRPGVPLVGVTSSERVAPRLPTEAHDAPMTHLATETGVHPI